MNTDNDMIASNVQMSETVSLAVVEGAGAVKVSLRIFPDHVEVDVVRPGPRPRAAAGAVTQASLLKPGDVVARAPAAVGAEHGQTSFADWMAAALRREGMTTESAARQLGVSVKTVSRWVGGATEPRLRELRRIHEVFGEVPL